MILLVVSLVVVDDVDVVAVDVVDVVVAIIYQ
jgi:hypothetical protein